MALKWVSIKSALPKIPKGRYGISVLVVSHDRGDNSQTVSEMIYGIIDKRKCPLFKGIKDKKYFMTLYSGPNGSEWGPPADEITDWMYLPKPPKK